MLPLLMHGSPCDYQKDIRAQRTSTWCWRSNPNERQRKRPEEKLTISSKRSIVKRLAPTLRKCKLFPIFLCITDADFDKVTQFKNPPPVPYVVIAQQQHHEFYGRLRSQLRNFRNFPPAEGEPTTQIIQTAKKTGKRKKGSSSGQKAKPQPVSRTQTPLSEDDMEKLQNALLSDPQQVISAKSRPFRL